MVGLSWLTPFQCRIGVWNRVHGRPGWWFPFSKRGTGECARTIGVSHDTAFRGSLCQYAGKEVGPGRGTVQQLFTFARISQVSSEFAQPVCMCFVALVKAFDRVPLGSSWGMLRESGVPDPLQRAIRSLYACSRACARILGNKSGTFPVGVDLRQGCPLSPVLFVAFMYRISRSSRGEELRHQEGAWSRAATPSCRKESAEVVQGPNQDASWAPRTGGFPGTPN